MNSVVLSDKKISLPYFRNCEIVDLYILYNFVQKSVSHRIKVSKSVILRQKKVIQCHFTYLEFFFFFYIFEYQKLCNLGLVSSLPGCALTLRSLYELQASPALGRFSPTLNLHCCLFRWGGKKMLQIRERQKTLVNVI